MDWRPITERYTDSVIQLCSTKFKYDPYRPYRSPADKRVCGSGFIVDIVRGLVLTNAHVISNAVSLNGRMMHFGEYDLTLRVVTVCYERDVALCQLSAQDIKKILAVKGESVNMPFGDHLLLGEAEEVLAIGYPLGHKNVKFTTGVIAGFDGHG